MIMEKEFVNYNQALKLKVLGFDEPCFAFYLEDGTRVPASYSKEGTVYPSNTDLLPEWCTAPTFSQAFRWLREKYYLYHSIDPLGYSMCLGEVGELGNLVSCNVPNYGTYEEAELACLDKLIELVESK